MVMVMAMLLVMVMVTAVATNSVMVMDADTVRVLVIVPMVILAMVPVKVLVVPLMVDNPFDLRGEIQMSLKDKDMLPLIFWGLFLGMQVAFLIKMHQDDIRSRQFDEFLEYMKTKEFQNHIQKEAIFHISRETLEP